MGFLRVYHRTLSLSSRAFLRYRDSLTMMKMKVIGYWMATIVVAFELLVSGVMGLLHGRAMLIGKPVVEVMEHLGYPVYLLKILGWWKPLGAIALLAPRFPRRKEWAYAGTFFNMTGAAASSVACGDDVGASTAKPYPRSPLSCSGQSSNKRGIKPARACTDHPKKVA